VSCRWSASSARPRTPSPALRPVSRSSPTNPYPYNEFGLSIAFSGSDVVIGAPVDGTGGAVYVADVGDGIFVGNFEATP
jgi:hypothetical protein